jgi:hypothetical protein
MPKLNTPTQLTVIFSAAAGILVAFNTASFGFASDWTTSITIALTILAAWGISPLTGVAFRAILHLSNGVSVVIAAGLGALQVIFLQVSMGATLHGILAGVIAFAAGLGFAPSISLLVVPPAQRPNIYR